LTGSEPRLVFKGAAWKSGLRTLASLAFVWGVIMLWPGESDSGRYPREMVVIFSVIGIGLFGFTAALSFLKLCFPPELVLTPEGFSVRGLRKAVLIPWDDVQTFDLVEVSRGATMAGYILKPGARSGSRDRGITRAMIPGFDGTIAVFPEESPGWLVKVLNDWRRRYAPGE